MPISLDDSKRDELAKMDAQRHDWLAEDGRPDRSIGRWGYRRLSDFEPSTTDPHPALMKTRGGSHLGYLDHYVVDGGKARIIVNALAIPADVTENQPMLDLVWRTRFRFDLHPRQVTGDTTYGTVENIAAVEDAGIKAYVALPNFDERTGLFGKGQFTYDAERDTYMCPQGETLRFLKNKHTQRVRIYRAEANVCKACPLKAKCTDSSHGRQVRRSFDEDDLERARGYHETEDYEKARRKRSDWVEPLFAEAERFARLPPLPPTTAEEGERDRAPDGERPEPETAPEHERRGPPTMAKRGTGAAPRIDHLPAYSISV